MRWLAIIVLSALIGCHANTPNIEEIRRQAVTEVLDKQLLWLEQQEKKQKDARDEAEGKFSI